MQPANQPVDDLFGASDPNQNTQMQNEILKPKKTASDFLGGKGASLVNLDNLVSRPSIPGGNPFGSGGSGMKQNPFQKTSPGMYFIEYIFASNVALKISLFDST